MKKICIILGAGASQDLIAPSTGSHSQINKDFKPPLASELFDNKKTLNAILGNLKYAQPVISKIRSKLKEDNSASLEDLLSDLSKSTNPREAQQVKYIIVYIWSVISRISTGYNPNQGSPTNYDTLIYELLNKDYEILLLTLNYDTFLEDALEKNEGVVFNTMDDYLSEKWKLIKLHGSITWGKRIEKVERHNSYKSLSKEILDKIDLNTNLGDDILITKKENRELSSPLYIKEGRQEFLFPAITIPTSDKCHSMCPEEHKMEAISFLRNCSEFIIAGCGMNDSTIKNILQESDFNPKRINIVSNSEEGAANVFYNLKNIEGFDRPDRMWLLDRIKFTKGFSEYITSGALENFIR